ncbi:uncharacterized protein LOC122078897 [Macadamia integrifolia]|uniref:uncharacterized protein LOC122078897 n=1 Tax=Macadamia integrifolia TaxID=60698 RepID=UPI001C4E9965|nr:uncharacterized protein LOC122078897 [Macadamia integrifolia]
MADSTRLKTLDDAVKKFSEAAVQSSQQLETQKHQFEAHTLRMDHQQGLLADMVNQVMLLGSKIDCSLTKRPLHGAKSSGHQGENTGVLCMEQPSFPARSMRLDFPKFNGEDPLGWIFRAEQFFEFNGTGEALRLSIASFHMEGKALQWYQWMNKQAQFPSWHCFTHALEARFGPTEYEDHQGALAKLFQTSTVLDYQEKIEALANRCHNLSTSFLVSCFISGLKPEIRCEVMSFQLTTLPQTMGLAKLQEAKLNELKKSSWRQFGSKPHYYLFLYHLPSHCYNIQPIDFP